MEEIKKLIEITRKKGQRSLQLVNQNFRKKEISKDNLLYDSVLSGKYKDDDEAARSMFKTDPGNRNYRNTKGKLKQKLLNHLYFLDYEKDGYTNYDRVEYENLHALHQCYILIKEGANDIAVKKLPGLIKTAKLYEFVNISVQSVTMLRNEYAKLGKSTPYQELNEELNHLVLFQQTVHECEEKYFGILVLINKSVSAQNKIMSEIPGAIKFIEKKSEKFSSHRLEILACKLKLLFNRLKWQFRDNIELCNMIEKKYLNDGNHTDIAVDLDAKRLAINKINSYFHLRDGREGVRYAEQTIDIFKVGGDNWFRFIEYYFLMLMKIENFKKAEEIFRKVRTNKNFTELPGEVLHRWNIYRAYLVFVHETKLLKWGFDLDQYINDIPDINDEFANYNVSVLIIQLLFLLREGQVNDIRERVDLLEKYSSVHLDKRHNYRNSIMIRMLSIVTEKEFNYELIEEKGRTYMKKLEKFQIPFELEGDLEVIPYEKIWDYILSILKTNKLYIHYRFYNPVEG